MRGLIPIYFPLLVFLWITSCSKQENQNREESLPNILLLFSDQHNKKIAGYEGHPDVLTPNLDQLANESFVYQRAYAATGICAPSRSATMTGIYPRTLGILSNSENTKVMSEVVSLPKYLQQLGYKTYAFGKRHTKSAIDEGWDMKKSHLCGESEDNYVTWIEQMGYGVEFARDWGAEFGSGPNCSSLADTSFHTADLGTRISALPDGYTMEAYTASNTIEMIDSHKDSNDPFFCWATFYRPHQPYTPTKKFMELYNVTEWGSGRENESGIVRPPSFYEPTENLPPMLQSQRRGDNKVWNMNVAFEEEQIWRDYIGAYYALVTEVDHYIGEIISQLEKNGMKDNTIIIYTSDHGDFVGNHGMVEKAAMGHNVYEDILNIPLIIHYPGQGKKEIKYELVSQVDLFPTILEMIGMDIPEFKLPIQGRSLHSLMKHGQTFSRPYIVSESWSQASVITDNYKLGIMLDPSGFRPQFDYREFGDMFFDREEDSLEINNSINDPGYADDIEKLRSFYDEFQSKFPDTGKQQVIEAFQQKKISNQLNSDR